MVTIATTLRDIVAGYVCTIVSLTVFAWEQEYDITPTDPIKED